MHQDDSIYSQIDVPEAKEGLRQSGAQSVQFYGNEAVFLDSLGEFAGAALGAGGACVVIASGEHRLGLSDRLRAAGIDLSFARAMNRFISLDSTEIMSRFIVDGVPDENRFIAALEPHLTCARKAVRNRNASMVAFSEMVALQWQRSQYQAAIDIERMWNRLARQHSFSLRCAYPSGLFAERSQYDLFRQVSSTGNRVVSRQTSVPRESLQLDLGAANESMDTQSRLTNATANDEKHDVELVEEQIQHSEELCRVLVESKADSIYVLDLEGRIVFLNQAATAALPGDTRSILGKPWVALWKSEDQPRIQQAINCVKSDEPGHFQTQHLKEGAPQSWDVRLSPLHDSNGNVARILAVSRDTTDLTIAQRAAFEAEKQATAGQLAATIVHEINNPLEAVTNFLYLAKNSADIPPSVSEYLHIADNELSRVAQISRQILGFYRGGSKKQFTPIAPLIESVMTVFERRMRSKQIEPVISVEAGLEVYVTEGQLRQALLNLTSNAIDASHAGGKLWIRARRSKRWDVAKSQQSHTQGVRISIADNGVGMAPEVKRSIFVPFFTTKAQSGSGIGLWVTKCLIEQQGGRLNFCSGQGKKPGTVMSLWLPGFHAENDQRTEVAA